MNGVGGAGGRVLFFNAFSSERPFSGCLPPLIVWEADRVKSNPKTPNLGPIFFERYDHKG